MRLAQRALERVDAVKGAELARRHAHRLGVARKVARARAVDQHLHRGLVGHDHDDVHVVGPVNVQHHHLRRHLAVRVRVGLLLAEVARARAGVGLGGVLGVEDDVGAGEHVGDVVPVEVGHLHDARRVGILARVRTAVGRVLGVLGQVTASVVDPGGHRPVVVGEEDVEVAVLVDVDRGHRR